MEPNPNQDPYGEYKGYAPQQPQQDYTQEEMPQSTYPHPDELSKQPPSGQQYQQQSYYQPPYGQQQYNYQQSYGPVPGNYVGPGERTAMGLKARTAALCCYLLGWVSGLVFFLLERENRFVRFHAMQSILFFGILSLAQAVFSRMPFFEAIGSALGLVIFIGWIFLMVKANKGIYYKLPIIGDLAEKLANQIR